MDRGYFQRLPKKWPSEEWQTSWVPGVKAGDILYISGITASDPDGNPVGISDFAVQAERCLFKLKDVVERAGITLGNVVKLTTYLTPDVPQDQIDAYFQIRQRYFQGELPASTGVTVHSLRRPEFLVEIDAIAHVPPS